MEPSREALIPTRVYAARIEARSSSRYRPTETTWTRDRGDRFGRNPAHRLGDVESENEPLLTRRPLSIPSRDGAANATGRFAHSSLPTLMTCSSE
ncbi:hypothetical protein C477_11067 [Haloterrigena salina JCM 13891]|uniref:Uncharacterized protein n=1 Tax=Haloterrigena salina JCM 13891 TaxID=1227488 RepID=M0C5Y0_9EURY|nr:hypothetical protein C477_11067 [Haloterrigena salina JCM 13891]